MKWFDKVEIKEQGSLTQTQIDYIQSPSLGICAPFNCLFRKHFDYFLIYISLFIFNLVIFLNDLSGPITYYFLLVNQLLMIAMNYFFVRYGRRLAWNRNKWRDFSAFEKSEKKWNWLAIPTVFFMSYAPLKGLFKDPITLFFYILGCIAIFVPFFIHWSKAPKLQSASAVEVDDFQ
jgi:hypothetical protein